MVWGVIPETKTFLRSKAEIKFIHSAPPQFYLFVDQF